MDKQCAFVTGGRGMLGVALVEELTRKGWEIRGDVAGGSRVEITDWAAVDAALAAARPDVIWHLAAATDVDRCEREPDWAFATNGLATENIARAARRLRIPLVYVSTSGVFGSTAPVVHSELDTPSPVNVYARTKLYGERAVEGLAGDWFVLRAGWMVGGLEIDKKFVYRMISMLQSGQTELKAVDDKHGTPTFTDGFARKALELVEGGRFGLWHIANRGHATRYEMVKVIVSAMGLDEKVTVTPVPSSYFPLPAPRPGSEMIRTAKLEILGWNDLLPWQDALRPYVARAAHSTGAR
jgi:dTDP-4-dehydrorhamnose reductase